MDMPSLTKHLLTLIIVWKLHNYSDHVVTVMSAESSGYDEKHAFNVA